MMWTRKDLKNRAKVLLKANYWKAVIVSLILTFLTVGSTGSGAGKASDDGSGANLFDQISSFSQQEMAILTTIVAWIVGIAITALLIGILLKIFVLNVLKVGCYRYFVVCNTEKGTFGELTYGFRNSYMNIVKIMFLKDLFTLLWSLLFVIPGIVKSYEYRMIPYLLAEDASISKAEAFESTKQMMTGDKWNAFVLDLSFIGWWIVAGITCGLAGIFYVAPYEHFTDAQLYEVLKTKK